MKAKKYLTVIAQLAIIVCLIGVVQASASTQPVAHLQSFTAPTPHFTSAAAFDTSATLSILADRYVASQAMPKLDTN